MMIDAREPQVFERPGSKRFEEALVRDVGIERAGGNQTEQIKELFV